MAIKEMPMGLALIICDMIIHDKLTNKRTLVGLFDRLQTNALPCVHPALGIFVSLTSGHGKYDCEILCRHHAANETAFSVKGQVSLQNPMQVAELAFNVHGVSFRHEGEYWTEFRVDGVPVMMRRIFIVVRKKSKEEEEGNKKNF